MHISNTPSQRGRCNHHPHSSFLSFAKVTSGKLLVAMSASCLLESILSRRMPCSSIFSLNHQSLVEWRQAPGFIRLPWAMIRHPLSSSHTRVRAVQLTEEEAPKQVSSSFMIRLTGINRLIPCKRAIISLSIVLVAVMVCGFDA